MMSALSITWSKVTDTKEKAAAITLINACAIDDEAHEGEDEATYFIERFGDRSHLLLDIAQYLQLRGRCIDVPDPDCSMLFAGTPMSSNHPELMATGE